jgi:hypothetical protein
MRSHTLEIRRDFQGVYTRLFTFARNCFNILCNYTDLTGFHQTVELLNASLKTCKVLRGCIVTIFLPIGVAIAIVKVRIMPSNLGVCLAFYQQTAFRNHVDRLWAALF